MSKAEVETMVSRVGRPEIAADPMWPDMADTYAFLKPRSQCRPGITREVLVSEIAERLQQIPGIASSISQPIKFRMMELIEGVGVRSDVAVKIFGDDVTAILRAVFGASPNRLRIAAPVRLRALSSSTWPSSTSTTIAAAAGFEVHRDLPS